MAHAQASMLPPSLGETGFFAEFGGVRKKNLAGDGEDFFVGETIEKGAEKIALDAHVAVEQDHDVVSGCANPAIRSAAEAEIFVERDQADLRVAFEQNSALPSVEPLSTTITSLTHCAAPRRQ